jgi:hypothetical protein
MLRTVPAERGRALAWRLRRHALDPVDGAGAAEVVHRVVALRGWPADLAELAVGVRQARPEPGGLSRALDNGDLIRSYAFRGGSYLFTHDDAAAVLAARTASRIWENARWQRQGHFVLDDWAPFREAMREILASGPRTRDEIGAQLAGIPALRHLAEGATGTGSDVLYKPLHWWGDICFGPQRDQKATFRWLGDDPRWPGLPDPDEGGRRAVVRYLGAYGPATNTNLEYWFVEGLGVPRHRLQGWVSELAGDLVTQVSIDGQDAFALTSALDGLRSCEPSDSVRLLPGYDPWLLGPGTADPSLLAPARRALASRGSNLVIRRGVVSGTWQVRTATLTVSWFPEAGPAPQAALEAETRRLSHIQGRELRLTCRIT